MINIASKKLNKAPTDNESIDAKGKEKLQLNNIILKIIDKSYKNYLFLFQLT